MILGSGIDVVQVHRVERALARFGARFETRVFRDTEIRLCRRHRRPALQYARRFAAKEALMKAVGTGWADGVRWVDIETVPGRHGLGLRLHGRVAERVAQLGAGRAHLDVGGGGELALALVLLEGPAS